jgi:predicted dehydrogenase
VKLGVFFQDRVAPDIVALKRLVDAGRLGKPLLVSASVKWYRPPDYYGRSRWRGDWALGGGGALMNQGVHTVDLLLWLVGDVVRVYGKAVTGLHNIKVEDTVAATLEFANGAIGTLVAATSAYPGYPRRLEVTGTEGTIILENDRIIAVDCGMRNADCGPADFRLRNAECGLENDVNPQSAVRNPQSQDARSTSPVISDPRGHRIIIENFLKAIATGETPVCDGQEARRSVALVTALYESSRTGRAVSIADFGFRIAD